MERNPYAAPRHPPVIAEDRGTKTPASVTVFGILNIVFGGFGVLGLAFSAAVMLFAPRFPTGARNPVLELFDSSLAYRCFMFVSLAVGSILLVVQIVAGIGLLRKRSFGRTLSIGYGVFAILQCVVGTVGNWLFVLGPLLRQAQAVGGADHSAALVGVIGGVVGGCIGAVYPVVLLFFMTRRAVAEALAP